jgi:hypothetical protein
MIISQKQKNGENNYFVCIDGVEGYSCFLMDGKYLKRKSDGVKVLEKFKKKREESLI